MNSILVVKLSAIGDVIHALPVSYALKETYPEAKITWVVEPPVYDILRDNPYIDEILIFAFSPPISEVNSSFTILTIC